MAGQICYIVNIIARSHDKFPLLPHEDPNRYLSPERCPYVLPVQSVLKLYSQSVRHFLINPISNLILNIMTNSTKSYVLSSLRVLQPKLHS